MYTLETEDFFQNKDVCGIVLVLTDDDGNVTHRVEGLSRRTPGDKPDLDLGFDLAVGRALASLSRKFLKPAEGKIKNMEHNEKLKIVREQSLVHIYGTNSNECPACKAGLYGNEGKWTGGVRTAVSYSALVSARERDSVFS